MTEALQDATNVASVASGLVDCEVHVNVPNVQALFPYLPAYWREHINQTLFKGAVDAIYPRNAPVTARPGSVPRNGGVAGSE